MNERSCQESNGFVWSVFLRSTSANSRSLPPSAVQRGGQLREGGVSPHAQQVGEQTIPAAGEEVIDHSAVYFLTPCSSCSCSAPPLTSACLRPKPWLGELDAGRLGGTLSLSRGNPGAPGFSSLRLFCALHCRSAAQRGTMDQPSWMQNTGQASDPGNAAGGGASQQSAARQSGDA